MIGTKQHKEIINKHNKNLILKNKLKTKLN